MKLPATEDSQVQRRHSPLVYKPQNPRVKREQPAPTEPVQDGLLLEKSRLCQTRVVLNDQLLVADHGDLFALGLALKLCV